MIVVTRVLGDGYPGMRATLEAALLDSGKPLFIAPPGGFQGQLSSAAIAWNGGVEAARAVSCLGPGPCSPRRSGFPFLIEAGLRPGPSAENLVAYLARHGIFATIYPAASNPLPTGEVLLSDARSAAADFLVMGAYTHNRLRRLIMGSVTEYVLAEALLPVLTTPAVRRCSLVKVISCVIRSSMLVIGITVVVRRGARCRAVFETRLQP